VRLLADRDAELRARGIGWRITGIASRRLGWIADPAGLDVSLLGGAGVITPARFPAALRQSNNVLEWLRAARADALRMRFSKPRP